MARHGVLVILGFTASMCVAGCAAGNTTTAAPLASGSVAAMPAPAASVSATSPSATILPGPTNTLPPSVSGAVIPDGFYTTRAVTRAEAQAFLANRYPTDPGRVTAALAEFGQTEQWTMRLQNGQMQQGGTRDGANMGIGATAAFAFADDHTMVWQENEVSCVDTLTVNWAAGAFSLTIAKSTCPIDPIGQVIFESSPWSSVR